MNNKIKTSQIITLICVFALVANIHACKKAVVILETPKTTQIQFAINWDKIDPDAPVPEGAVLWLYHSEDPNVPIKIDLDNDKPIAVHLKHGVYSIITYNKNIQYLDVSGHTSFASHKGLVQNIVSESEKSKHNSGFQTIHKADFVHTLIGSDPRFVTVEPNKPLLVTLKPKTVNHDLCFTFNIDGTDKIKGGTAVITEVASNIFFSNAQTNSDFPAKILIPINEIFNNPLTKSCVLEAIGSTLGAYKNEAGLNNSELDVSIQFEDPQRAPIEFKHDISEKFNNIDNTHNNPHIVIDVVIEGELPPEIKVTLVPFEDEVFGDEIIIKPLNN